jgi:hypothetical protein
MCGFAFHQRISPRTRHPPEIDDLDPGPGDHGEAKWIADRSRLEIEGGSAEVNSLIRKAGTVNLEMSLQSWDMAVP